MIYIYTNIYMYIYIYRHGSDMIWSDKTQICPHRRCRGVVLEPFSNRAGRQKVHGTVAFCRSAQHRPCDCNIGSSRGCLWPTRPQIGPNPDPLGSNWHHLSCAPFCNFGPSCGPRGPNTGAHDAFSLVFLTFWYRWHFKAATLARSYPKLCHVEHDPDIHGPIWIDLGPTSAQYT